MGEIQETNILKHYNSYFIQSLSRSPDRKTYQAQNTKSLGLCVCDIRDCGVSWWRRLCSAGGWFHNSLRYLLVDLGQITLFPWTPPSSSGNEDGNRIHGVGLSWRLSGSIIGMELGFPWTVITSFIITTTAITISSTRSPTASLSLRVFIVAPDTWQILSEYVRTEWLNEQMTAKMDISVSCHYTECLPGGVGSGLILGV